ncbi:histidine kinase [Labilibaculum sp. DW002]|uniref:histidine kinase n=1 Tax=Paralabilibaculum antarcticum TaxID=2912572 RepID=A0ABT5VMR1_9BACT|nr:MULTISPECIES: histidine kinase [unclassified Labilibaculum]MBI9058663.1 hypothetical protein [Labilibaculum sp.]MDE5416703.1 histidine kinase [Labilibaculum sp. DW002]
MALLTNALKYMRIKKNFFIKQKIVIVLLLFSFVAFAGIIYTFQTSSNLDAQHIQLVESSEKIEIEVFNARIMLDEFLDGDTSIKKGSILECYGKANNYIKGIGLITTNSDSLKLDQGNRFLYQLTKLDSSIVEIKKIVQLSLNKRQQGNDSSLLNSNRNFILIFNEYEKSLHSYISESNNLLKRKIFILLTAVFIILIISLILIVRLMNSLIRTNRELLRNTMKVEQSERKRIAMDLHDGLGAMLSSVGLYSKILEKEFKDNKQASSNLNQITQLSNQALQTVSEVINNLNPSILKRHNIVESLDRFCSRINKVGNLKLQFNADEFFGKMDKSREVILYRICSELINNTIKHANATKASIVLSRTTKVMLKYQDNGIGFNRDELLVSDINGMGLTNIIDRVESIGGQCLIDTSKGNGFAISIEIGIDKRQ